MGTARHKTLTALLGRLTSSGGEQLGDAELLDRFNHGQDQEAFRALVERHAPLVWGVCSRILDRQQDAEDAFQATFIVLARKADRLPRGDYLPAWLHQVARHSALKVRQVLGRRREVIVDSVPDVAAASPEEKPDLARVLDEELGQLPARLRRPLIACFLQGRTYAEVARSLGCSVSTVCRRVEEGGNVLRDRLVRRGVAPAGCGAGSLLPAAALAQPVPAGLAATAASQALGSLPVSSTAAAVADAVMRSMAAGKAWLASVVAVAVLSVAGGLGLAALPRPAVPADQLDPSRPPLSEDGGRTDRFGDPLPHGAVARIGTLRFRAEQAGSCGDVTFLASGRTLASAHSSGNVLLWEVASGRVAKRLTAPYLAHRLAVSPDDRRIVVAGRDQVWAWDLTAETPRLVWTWEAGGAERVLTALAYSPDGSTVAVGDPNGNCVRLLDAATGLVCGVLDGCSGVGLAFSPDGALLGCVQASERPGREGRLVLWELASGRTVEAKGGPENRAVTNFAFAPEGRTVAWVGRDGDVRVWDVDAGREVANWTAASPQPFLAYVEGGRTVAEFGSDRIVFRDPATGEENQPAVPAADLGIVGQASPIHGMRISPDGKLFATAVSNGQVAVWDVATGREVGADGRIHGTLSSLAFSPDGKTVTSFSGIHAVARTWDAETGTPRTCLALAPGKEFIAGRVVYDAAGSPHAFQIRSAGEPLSLVSWNPDTGEVTNRLEIPADRRVDRFTTIAASPDGRLLAWCVKGVVTLADRATGRELRQLKRTRAAGGYIPLAFTPDGETLVAYSRQSRLVEVWAVETGELRSTLSLPADPRPLLPRHMTLSHDGRWVAITNHAGAGKAVVELWEIASGRAGQRFESDAQLHRLAFSPDGALLAAAAENGSVRLWNLTTGTPCEPFRGHQRRVVEVTFSPDGRRLASGSLDGTGLVWDVSEGIAVPTPRRVDAAALWTILSGTDAAAAHRAGFALAANPADAVSLLAERLPAATPTAAVRGVAVLERIGSPAARAVLADLASRPADEPVSRESAVALRRLRSLNVGRAS